MNSTIKGVCAFLLGAVALGSVINTLRPNPLPWRYEKSTAQPVAAAGESEVPSLISLEELRAVAPEQVLIIDARPPLFFRRSHIPGAINIAKQHLTRDFSMAEPLLRKAGAKRFVIYCSHEECEDSQVVARELIRFGYRRVAVFKGGWKAWQEAGMKEEKG